jgi:hypothetical protein
MEWCLVKHGETLALPLPLPFTREGFETECSGLIKGANVPFVWNNQRSAQL